MNNECFDVLYTLKTQKSNFFWVRKRFICAKKNIDNMASYLHQSMINDEVTEKAYFQNGEKVKKSALTTRQMLYSV